jgi:hypothetical protein
VIAESGLRAVGFDSLDERRSLFFLSFGMDGLLPEMQVSGTQSRSFTSV